jgi:hypothetical protein
VAKESVQNNNERVCGKKKSSFSLSTFLWRSSTQATGLPILFLFKIATKTAFDAWFIELQQKVLDHPVISWGKFQHRS